MLFKGRNQIPFDYSCYGWTRYGGTKFHGGKDIVGMDDTTIYFPTFKGKSITGTVVSSTIVPEGSSDRTWEWGYFVCVMINANQTGDPINYLYFCHNEKNLVSVGQQVKSGDAIAIMGNTGNAKYASPPIKHVHFEARISRSGTGQDPSDFDMLPNVAGIYNSSEQPTELIYGVDVSRHQRFNAMKEIVANGKADFAILRVCVADMYIDDYFDVFYSDAKDNLKLGYYSANYFTTVPNAIKEADYTVNYLEKIGIAAPDLPIFVDWEGFSYDWYVDKIGEIPSNQLIRDMTEAYVNRIKERGYVAGIYLNRDYYNNKYGTAFMDKMKASGVWVWLADPSNPTTPLIACDIHQYEVADGIDYGYTGGNLDKNKLYKPYITEQPSGGDFDKMLLKSFGSKNMQGFAFPDANGAVTYDNMPNGYRVVTERGITGTDGQGWEWVKLLDERNGNAVYTPLLSDRNELLDDAPLLEPESTGSGDCDERIAELEKENQELKGSVALAEQTLQDHMELLIDREKRLDEIHTVSNYKEV